MKHKLWPVYDMVLDTTKPVFGVSNKARLKPGSSAIETSYKIAISPGASLDMMLSKNNKGTDQSACMHMTGPRSAVGNLSGNRCESDCRSRGREFDPGPVPYFRGD